MHERYSRTEKLIGSEGVERLKSASVLVMGCGGVGSYAAEAVARAGIGKITLMDGDDAAESNLNRQLIATLDTVGMDKTQAVRERVKSINPDCKVTEHKVFFLPENADTIDFSDFDYVVDAIDTIAGKLAIIEKCSLLGIPVISSMGTSTPKSPRATMIPSETRIISSIMHR